MINRRSLLIGLIAAPAIVKIDSLMPVKILKIEPQWVHIHSNFDNVLKRWQHFQNGILVKGLPEALGIEMSKINKGAEITWSVEFWAKEELVANLIKGAWHDHQ